MKPKYSLLYKRLVEAYYKGDFEGCFNQLLNESFDSPKEAKEVIAILCGVESVDTKDDHEFMQEVINQITQNKVRDKIVQKVRDCTEDCEQINGKTKCQSVCPFDAIIRKASGGDKWIDETLCMSCGRCVEVCDQGNYMDTPQFLPVLDLMKNHKSVIAIVAPAIAGQYGDKISLDQLREAIIKIGFKDMVEVAIAADILSLKEALEFDAHVQHKGDFMITSCCCPMWVAALRKVYHDLVKDVSPSVSPMIAMARILKKLDPGVKVVFIGPCVAKKAEAKEKDLVGDVDYVLTFQELQIVFEALEIDPSECEGVPAVDYASTGGRLYARTGGVSQAVWDIVDQLFPQKRELFSSVQADGMRDCKTLLENLQEGKTEASFVEGMGCIGGCVGGPKAIISKEEGKKAVDQVAYDSAIKIPVHSEVLTELMKQIGVEDIYELKEGHSMFERFFLTR